MQPVKPKQNTAFLYCSIWPDEKGSMTLQMQSLALQTYCLMQGFDIVDIFSDIGPYIKGKGRLGLEGLLKRAQEENIGHILVHDISRIARSPKEVMHFLRETVNPNQTEIHITSWNLATGTNETEKFLTMAADIVAVESLNSIKSQPLPTEKLRLKPLWSKLFGMLQDERFAEGLIRALFEIKDSVQMNEKESQAVHGGYDHLHMFRALGFRIKGENTDNTKLVCDVLVRQWDLVKAHIGADLGKIIEGSETGAFL